MRATNLKAGDRVIFTGPVGYYRAGKTVVQRPNPSCCGNHAGMYLGAIPASDRVFVASFDCEGNIVLTSEDEFLRGVKSIQMRWLHQVNPAPMEKVTLEDAFTKYEKDNVFMEEESDLDNLIELAVQWKNIQAKVEKAVSRIKV